MEELTEFFSIQTSLLSQIPKTRRRFFVEKIDWGNRLLGIVGGRGTGKTTLLLQHLAHREQPTQKHLYISADHIQVQAIGLYEIGSSFFRLAGETLIVDEIHKYANWAQELKNLYDSFPTSKIFFSGSSTLALQKGKADLSRRALFYTLPGLSFREYLYLAHRLEFESVSLQDIFESHSLLASTILEAGPVLGHFKDYLDHGVYPFFLEGIQVYFPKLLNVLEKVLYEDIPTTTGIKTANVPTLKRILWLIATSQPFIPNIERMSRNLKVSKEYVYTYLEYLERGGILLNIRPSATGYRLVRKPSKIYTENTNLLRAIVGELGARGQEGAIRETFLAHQLKSAGLDIHVPAQADFIVQSKYQLEVGGKSKGKTQVGGTENAYVVRDDMEVGYGNIVPLWLFGFLY